MAQCLDKDCSFFVSLLYFDVCASSYSTFFFILLSSTSLFSWADWTNVKWAENGLLVFVSFLSVNNAVQIFVALLHQNILFCSKMKQHIHYSLWIITMVIVCD